MPSLTVHHLQVGQGERIPWLLEELSMPYNLKLYQRTPLFSPPDLKALHPMGASPVLEDATFDAEHPLILAESGAIIDYVIHKHGNGRLALPPSHPNYADYLYWFHFANATIQPAIIRRMTVMFAVQDTEHQQYKMTSQRLHNVFSHLNNRVTEKTWLAGDEFTAADIMSVWSFTAMRKFETIDLSEYPGILAWLKRCTDRPAYGTAHEKADPQLEISTLISAEGPEKVEALRGR